MRGGEDMKRITWFSCGVSSALAAALTPDSALVRITIDDEHPDNERFCAEMEMELGREITKLRSPYGGVVEVIRAQRYVNGPGGAACTKLLKRRVREEFERTLPPDVEYVWGFDAGEAHRFERMRSKESSRIHHAPLIDRWLTKSDAHGLFARMFPAVRRPAMYDLGYPNNNCIGCVKGGKGYWNKIRVDFPRAFGRMALLEREIGRSCINGTFLDELEPSAGKSDPVVPTCGLACVFGDA
jgi:hypothetical protein